jgi:hypothetical protein
MLDNLLKVLMTAAAFGIGLLAVMLGFDSHPLFASAYVTICGALLLMGGVRVTYQLARYDDEFSELWMAVLMVLTVGSVMASWAIADMAFQFKGY